MGLQELMAQTFLVIHEWSFRLINIEANPLNIISFFVAITIIIYSCKQIRNRNNINLPPSPPKLPIIGNLHQVGKQFHRGLQALSTKYGPLITLHLGNTQFLLVSSAELVDEIVSKQDVIFSDKPDKRGMSILLAGSDDLAFSKYNNYFKFVNKICVHQLLSATKVQAFEFVREEETRRVLEKIKLMACQDKAVDDLKDIFLMMSSSIIAKSAFGRVLNYDCESAGKLARKALHLSVGVWVGDLFPYMGWMDVLIGNTRRLKTISKELHTFLDAVIQDHQDLKPDEQKSEEKDFVDILLEVQQDPNVDIRLTRLNIKAILLDMFLGGTESSATAIEWAMAELMKSPSKMKKAQEEVRRVVGKKSKVDEKDIKEMKYLKLVIKETMRLHGPVVTRATSKRTVLGGYDIPKMPILLNLWAIHRDPKSWDKADEFYPERFDGVDANVRGNRGYFLPFGFGRRICPGINQAIAVMEYMLANLLYWFDWKLPYGSTLQDFDMNDSYELIIQKRKPLVLVPVAWSP
ncbi:hypothetical protein ACFE04_020817 [Oxalis oulophora]